MAKNLNLEREGDMLSLQDVLLGAGIAAIFLAATVGGYSLGCYIYYYYKSHKEAGKHRPRKPINY